MYDEIALKSSVVFFTSDPEKYHSSSLVTYGEGNIFQSGRYYDFLY